MQMSSGLRKCVSFGPPPTPNPPRLQQPEGYVQDYRFHGNDGFVQETGTRWIKLWARWDLMQPLPPDQVPWEQLGEASNPGLAYIASLDAQIAHARAQDPPVSVILQSYCFPRWANGTAEVVSGRFSVEDFEFETAQRVSAEAIAAHDFDAPRKLLVFRLPPFEQMGPDGWWGRWVRFLYERYMGHGWGLVLDLLNEPNNQWWPQRGPDSAVRYCARMMQAAQEIAAEHGHPSPLGAPGLADIVGPTGDLLGNYSDFVPALLSELDGIGFAAHPQFIWTHHNYIDMEADPGDHSPEGPSRATEVREMLAGRWSGWRGTDPDVPGVWLTEGGVRVNRLLARARAPDPEAALELQAELIRRNWDRHDSDTGPDGPGIEMVTNYLMYTDLGYDSGLREPLVPGTTRPAYETWRRLPSRA
ncbi:MAG: hypothetical protein M3481_00420 [Actinomycetota bacterium]|nr:hypothetical protein [Actinomycetota bacterium]